MATKKKTAKKKQQKSAVSTQEPNIQFVGREKLSNDKWRELDAPQSVQIGMREVKLPDSETQKKGFYLPAKDAGDLRRMYPHYWKEPTKKGKK